MTINDATSYAALNLRSNYGAGNKAAQVSAASAQGAGEADGQPEPDADDGAASAQSSTRPQTAGMGTMIDIVG